MLNLHKGDEIMPMNTTYRFATLLGLLLMCLVVQPIWGLPLAILAVLTFTNPGFTGACMIHACTGAVAVVGLAQHDVMMLGLCILGLGAGIYFYRNFMKQSGDEYLLCSSFAGICDDVI